MARRSRLVFLAVTSALLGVTCWQSSTAFMAVPIAQPVYSSVPQHFRGSGASLGATSSEGSTISALHLASTVAFASLAVGFAARRSRKSGLASGTRRAGKVGLSATQDELKKQAGYQAVDDYVKSGTVVGLGTGSTAYFAVERVGQLLKSGKLKDILAVPTSERTMEQAKSLGIPLTTLNTHSDLDVAIDGADEADPDLNLTKGGGGALFREKIVEKCAKKFVVIVDESKLVDGLGPGFPVPVEIVPFCHEHTMRQIAALPALAGCEPVLRLGSSSNNKRDGDAPAVTDNGNYIVDLHFTTPIKDVAAAADQLTETVGVVEHGLFVDMASACIIAGKDGITVRE